MLTYFSSLALQEREDSQRVGPVRRLLRDLLLVRRVALPGVEPDRGRRLRPRPLRQTLLREGQGPDLVVILF